MIGGYVYTPYIWPSLFTTILLVVLSVYALRRRSVPGALPFAAGALFAALWALGAGMEVAAVAMVSKVFWVKFQAAWQLPATTGITCFVLEYTWPGRWLTRRVAGLLSLVPLVYLGLILTNDLHHLSWYGFAFEGTVLPLRGPASWLGIAYGYGLSLINILLFGWLFLRSPAHRLPVAIILVGQVGARASYLLEATDQIRSGLPLDVLMLGYLFLVYAIALFGLRIFDPVPLARQLAIAQMRDGMVVLDPQGRVASVNPAAQGILGAPAKQILGRPVGDVLPAWAGAVAEDQTIGARSSEIRQEAGPEARYYALESSPLTDWRGLEVGHLLLLHDISAQKQAQTRLIAQQRALAMLRERERLARELHDSLGQIFAFVNSQGQAIRRLLSRRDVATADALTGRLVEVAREADVDIRESILGLRVALSEQGLFPALASYLASYEKKYGIHAELVEPELFAAAAFAPLVEVQLLRIVQEALTNVRKHAGASCVEIALALEDGCARVAIRDDGQGFDPAEFGGRADGHVGLQVMRERAEEVGGTLSLRSAPGQGTEVVVRVPVKGRGRSEDAEIGRRGDWEKRDG